MSPQRSRGRVGAERVTVIQITDRMAHVAWEVFGERIVSTITAPATNELVRAELRQFAEALRQGHRAYGVERSVERSQGQIAESTVESRHEMSTRDAAARLGVTSTQAVEQLIKSGRLDAVQDAPGRPWRIDEASVDREIARRARKAS